MSSGRGPGLTALGTGLPAVLSGCQTHPENYLANRCSSKVKLCCLSCPLREGGNSPSRLTWKSGSFCREPSCHVSP